MDDEGSFSVPPPWTGWDSSVAVQQEALAARRVGDLLAQARAHNALGMLCLRPGYGSSAHIEFEKSLGILEGLGDDRWMPVVLTHLAESRIGVALYQEAEEILTGTLAAFRERGDADGEAEALRLIATIQDERKRWFTRPDPDNPTP